MLDYYDSLSFYKDGQLNLTASPVFLTKFISEEGFKINGKTQVKNGIKIFSTPYFCPKDYFTGKITRSRKTISIHHFNMFWVNEEEKNKMIRIGKLKRFFGLTIARNIVEFHDIRKKSELKGEIQLINEKIKRKVRKQ